MIHTRGMLILTCIVSACLALGAAKADAFVIAEPILSINAHLGDTHFTPEGGLFDLGQLTVNEVLPVTLVRPSGQSTITAEFSLVADLLADLSSGGHAYGVFNNGSITIKLTLPQAQIVYFQADNLTLSLEEAFEDRGILAGSGAFLVTGGVWAPDFGPNAETGQISQITFRIQPSDLDDFDDEFVGTSDITLTPTEGGGDIPEPATLLLVGTGALGAMSWIRMRRVR